MSRKIETLSTRGMNLGDVVKSTTGGLTAPTATWQLVALHEILVELRKLNSLLHCPNFQRMPEDLRNVRRNTAKPRAPRKRLTP